MNKLAVAIDLNFENEKKMAFAQLSDFYKKDSPNKDALRIVLKTWESQFDKPSKLTKLNSKGAGCDPSWSCRAQILSKSFVPDLLKSYPYLEYIGWSDFRGEQRVKWTTKNSVTPFLK